jgi:hypothetical protein
MQLARKIVELPCSMAKGRKVRHPADNRLVHVVDGDADTNWWTWRVVNADGSLGEYESGYGW